MSPVSGPRQPSPPHEPFEARGPSTVDPSTVLRVATGVERMGPMAGSGYRVPPHLVRRADGQVAQVSPLLDVVLGAIDGARDLAAVAETASRVAGRELHVDDVHYLVEHKLRPLGLLCGADGAEPTVSKLNPLLGLRGRIAVTDPDRTWAVTRPFLWLFRPAVTVSASLAFVALAAWVIAARGLTSAIDDAVSTPGTMLGLIGLIVASAAFHEIGHAAACRYGGARPGVMGAAIYLVWPAFYTDVTDSYRLSRAGRLRVDLGGLYFNAIFALGTGALWAVTGVEALLVLVPVQLLQMVRQLVPLVRFDGYHILADLIGVPDLFARIKPTLARAIPWSRTDHGPNPLRPWAQAVVVTWVAVVIPALVVMFGYLLVHLPAMIRGALSTIRLQAEVAGIQLDRGNFDAVLLGIISIGLVALVPASSVYLLGRLAQRGGKSFWRYSDGRPALRVGALAVLLLLVAISGPGLLPTETGQPAAAGSVAEGEVAAGPADAGAVPPGVYAGVDPAVPVVRALAKGRTQAATLSGGSVRSAEQIAPSPTSELAAGKPLPQLPVRADVPRLPDDLPPAGAAWPFPFDPPAPPAPGDNHVVVPNWTDGSTAFGLSAAIVWDHDDSMTQANRAYALAMCTNCRTVAAAFQIVASTVPNRVAIPQNVAMAVNIECDTCVTEAVAVQLAVTLDGMPDKNVQNRLAAMVKSVNARKAWYQKRTAAEIRAEFRALETKALELLAPWIRDPSDDTDDSTALENSTASPVESADPTADQVPLLDSSEVGASDDLPLDSGAAAPDTSDGAPEGDAVPDPTAATAPTTTVVAATIDTAVEEPGAAGTTADVVAGDEATTAAPATTATSPEVQPA